MASTRMDAKDLRQLLKEAARRHQNQKDVANFCNMLESYVAYDYDHGSNGQCETRKLRGGICTKDQVQDCVAWAIANPASLEELSKHSSEDKLGTLFAGGSDGADFVTLANSMGFVRSGERNLGESDGQFVGTFFDPFEPNHFTRKSIGNTRKLLRVFRCLSPEDSAVLHKRGGIECKQRRMKEGHDLEQKDDRWLDKAAMCHVLHGSSKDAKGREEMLGVWISTTKNMGITIKFAGLFQDLALISIDEKLDPTSVLDLEDNEVLQASATNASMDFQPQEREKIITYASRAHEVLIKDKVPKENVRILTKKVVECTVWPFKDAGNQELTLPEQHLRNVLLKLLQKTHGMFASESGDSYMFPRAEDVSPDMFKLVRSLGGPNDRMCLCRLRKDLGALKEGTLYILKQAKPNLGDAVQVMISDEEMILQLRLSWIANTIYLLLSDRNKGKGITNPKACLYEYKANFRDFLAFNYVDAGRSQRRTGAQVWQGSFLLFRYDEDLEFLVEPEGFKQAVDVASGLDIDRFIVDDLVADCLMGVSFKKYLSAGDSDSGYRAGRLTKSQFLVAPRSGSLLRLPSALEHCLGSSIFPLNVNFGDIEGVSNILADRALQCQERPLVLCDALQSFWKECDHATVKHQVVGLAKLLDNSTCPTLSEADCILDFTRCIEKRWLFLIHTKERVGNTTGENMLSEIRVQFHVNRIALLFSDPLERSETHLDKRDTSEKSEAIGKNHAQCVRVANALKSLENLELRFQFMVATSEALLAASDNCELLVLNVDVKVQTDEGYTDVRLELESNSDQGAADFVELHSHFSERMNTLSHRMESVLRWEGLREGDRERGKGAPALDENGFLAIASLLEHLKNTNNSNPAEQDYREAEVRYLVANAQLKRFEISACGARIRAVCGQPDMPMKKIDGTAWRCVYGCTSTKWAEIHGGGIRLDEGKYIRLLALSQKAGAQGSDDTSSARPMNLHSFDVLVHIDISKAIADGLEFFKVENEHLILTKGNGDTLPNHYFTLATNSQGTTIWSKDVVENPVSPPAELTTLISRLSNTAAKVLVILSENSLRHDWTGSFRDKVKMSMTMDMIFVDGSVDHMTKFTRLFFDYISDGKSVKQSVDIATENVKRIIHESEPRGGGSRTLKVELIENSHLSSTVDKKGHKLLVKSESSKQQGNQRTEPEAKRQQRHESIMMELPTSPIYGRKRDLFRILKTLETKHVNVWANIQLGKSATAYELARYCRQRDPRVLLIEVENSDEVEGKKFWNFISRRAMEFELTVRLPLTYDERDPEAGPAPGISGGNEVALVSLLVIDAGQMTGEMLKKVFEGSAFFSHIQRHMRGMKVVVFSQDDLEWNKSVMVSYRLPDLDIESAESAFWDQRGDNLLSNFHQDYGMESLERSNVTELFKKLHHAKLINMAVIRPLARLTDSQLSTLIDCILAAEESSPAIEILHEELFNFLSPELRQALLACCLTPDLFRVNYLKAFNKWEEVCWKAFWQVELSPAGSCKAWPFKGSQDADVMLEMLVKAGVIRMKGSNSDGARMLRSLISSGFVYRIHENNKTGVTTFHGQRTGSTEVCKGAYYSLSDDLRRFCKQKIKSIQDAFPEYAEIVAQRKKAAIEGLMLDMMNSVAVLESGLREFSLLFKNWRWAVEECVLEISHFVPKDEAGRLRDESQKVTLKEKAHSALGWAILLSKLLWIVRRLVNDFASVLTINRWVDDAKRVFELASEAGIAPTRDSTLALAQCYAFVARINLKDYAPRTFKSSIKYCEKAITLLNPIALEGRAKDSTFSTPADSTAVESAGDADELLARPESLEISNFAHKLDTVTTVTMEALITKGIVKSWSLSEGSCKRKEAEECFRKAEQLWNKVSDEKQLSDPNHHESTLLWVEIMNHLGSLRINGSPQDESAEEEVIQFHERLFTRFRENEWMRERYPREYFRCLHDVAIGIMNKAKVRLCEDEKKRLWEEAESLLVQAHNGRVQQLDYSSVSSMIDLAHTRMELMEVRERLSSKSADYESLKLNYRFRRHTSVLLKRVKKIRNQDETLILPPRLFDYERHLKVARDYFTNALSIAPKHLLSLGRSLLTIPYQGSHTAIHKVWSEKCREEYILFNAVSNDIFTHGELCFSLTFLMKEFAERTLDKHTGSQAISDFCAQAQCLWHLASALSLREPEWAKVAMLKKHEILTDWAEGCPLSFNNTATADRNRKREQPPAHRPLGLLLFAPPQSTSERLELLAISITIDLHFSICVKPADSPVSRSSTPAQPPTPIRHRTPSVPNPSERTGSSSSTAAASPPTGGGRLDSDQSSPWPPSPTRTPSQQSDALWMRRVQNLIVMWRVVSHLPIRHPDPPDGGGGHGDEGGGGRARTRSQAAQLARDLMRTTDLHSALELAVASTQAAANEGRGRGGGDASRVVVGSDGSESPGRLKRLLSELPEAAREGTEAAVGRLLGEIRGVLLPGKYRLG